MEKFLKKSGLYILPQIVNILKGDMTFVGPKAYSEKQKEDMGEYYSYIIQHKPGITGIPQISKYAKDNFLDRLDMDLRYHYRRNFSLDLKIILITLLITLRAKKTYNIGSQINKSIKDEYQLTSFEYAHILKYQNYIFINSFEDTLLEFEKLKVKACASMIFVFKEDTVLVRIASSKKDYIKLQIKGYTCYKTDLLEDHSKYLIEDIYEHFMEFRRER